MKSLFRTKKRKGISPLLATVLLVGLTLVAGGAVYSIYTASSSAVSGGTDVRIDAVNAVKGTDYGSISITLTNTGKTPWKTVEVGVLRSDGTYSTLYELANNFAAADSIMDDGVSPESPITALTPEYFGIITEGKSHHAAGIGYKFLVSTDEEVWGASQTAKLRGLTEANLASAKPIDWAAYDDNDFVKDTQEHEAKGFFRAGKKLLNPIDSGKTISFEAALITPNSLHENTLKPGGDEGGPDCKKTTGDAAYCGHIHVHESNVGDELVIKARVTSTTGETVVKTTTVRVMTA